MSGAEEAEVEPDGGCLQIDNDGDDDDDDDHYPGRHEPSPGRGHRDAELNRRGVYSLGGTDTNVNWQVQPCWKTTEEQFKLY